MATWFVVGGPLLISFMLGALAERWRQGRQGRQDDREGDERVRLANLPPPPREACAHCDLGRKWAPDDTGCPASTDGNHTWHLTSAKVPPVSPTKER